MLSRASASRSGASIATSCARPDHARDDHRRRGGDDDGGARQRRAAERGAGCPLGRHQPDSRQRRQLHARRRRIEDRDRPRLGDDADAGGRRRDRPRRQRHQGLRARREAARLDRLGCATLLRTRCSAPTSRLRRCSAGGSTRAGSSPQATSPRGVPSRSSGARRAIRCSAPAPGSSGRP